MTLYIGPAASVRLSTSAKASKLHSTGCISGTQAAARDLARERHMRLEGLEIRTESAGGCTILERGGQPLRNGRHRFGAAHTGSAAAASAPGG